MLETYWGHCVPSDYEGGADRCEDFISTANVIVLTGIIEGHPDPVGEPGDNAIDVAKLEVAREIFAELEEIADTHYGTYSVLNTKDYCDLKKKYTEVRE
jgi:hypothetical protein